MSSRSRNAHPATTLQRNQTWNVQAPPFSTPEQGRVLASSRHPASRLTRLTRLSQVIAGHVSPILLSQRARPLLSRTPRLRGKSPQMRSLGRNEHKTRDRRSPLLRALQRLEADVRLPNPSPHTRACTTLSRSLTFHPFVFFVSFCSWDEWVPTARLLKFNETNLALQKDLSKAQAAATSASASASKTATSARGAQAGGGRRKEGGRGTKRGRDDDDGTRRPEMRLVVPDTLKVLLVDDWEAVTKNNQVRPPRMASFWALSSPRPASVGHSTSKSHCRGNT